MVGDGMAWRVVLARLLGLVHVTWPGLVSLCQRPMLPPLSRFAVKFMPEDENIRERDGFIEVRLFAI